MLLYTHTIIIIATVEVADPVSAIQKLSTEELVSKCSLCTPTLEDIMGGKVNH